jgi:cobalt/nickel transport system ATP-binding protein
MAESPLLALRDATFHYSAGPAIFSHLNFSLMSEDHIGICGPNGGGKTTLLRMLIGLETLQHGTLLFEGQPVKTEDQLHQLRCSVGFILQNSDDQLFSGTVLEDVAFGPLNLGYSPKEARLRSMETLEQLGIAGLAERITHRLSGGEKKMVAIATVLSMRPKALLLDEPTIFLDDRSRERIIQILKALPIARITVSHDRSFLEAVSSRILRLQTVLNNPVQLVVDR